MDLITQRNQQASPEDPANHVCEILSEIKDIKHTRIPHRNLQPDRCGPVLPLATTSLDFIPPSILHTHQWKAN